MSTAATPPGAPTPPAAAAGPRSAPDAPASAAFRAFLAALPQMRAQAAAEHAEALDDLRALVETETPSADPAALDAAARELLGCAETLMGPLGRVELHAHEEHGPTLILDVPGELPGRVVVVGHYDTVWPLGTLGEIPFSVEDGIVRGPGVLDMKAGLVTGFRAVRLARAHGLQLPSLTFVLNGDEELGSPSSRPLIEREAAGADAGLVIEPGVDWDLKVERKGVGVFSLEVAGVESHAGNDPEGGASAVTALAELVLQLNRGTDLAAGTSVNVGTVSGGTARNVVPGRARASVDVRVTTPEEAARIDRLFSGLTVADPRVSFTVGGGWNRPPMALTDGSRALLSTVQQVADRVRAPLGQRSVGGGSDANFLSALGVPVLDGLGASGNGPHARSEHVLEADMDDRVLLLAGVLATAFAD